MLIRLAGVVAVEQPETVQVRHLSSAQAQVAFARLTLERAHGTGRDQLADTVWPDGLPDTWASALRSVVSRVRAFVSGGDPSDEPSVVSQGGRYLLRLPAGATVDLELAETSVGTAARAFAKDDFAEARRLAASASACLRRPFLPEHEGEWVTSVRQRLDELLVAALETASLASSALGEDREALRYADEAVQRAPLRESAHRCRMTAHVAAGNRAEALRAYNTLRRMLAEELGVDPAPETQALYLELLAAPAATSPAPHRDLLRPKPGAAAPFVGRRAELAMLAESWAQAESGDSHLVLISGEPGIGKTRLTTAAANRVGLAGGVVLHGRCEPSSGQAFQPLIEALSGYVAATPADALPDLGRAAAATLTALAAGERFGDSEPDQLAALTDVVVRLARTCPVFLVLDDLHLASEDTLMLLRQLLRRRRGCHLLVVATAPSPVHYPPAFAAAVRDMDREGHLLRTVLTGLSEPDVATLTGQIVPAAATRSLPTPRRLVADTAGNPYLLISLLRWHCERDGATADAREELPSGVYDYAAERLAALAPEPRRLLTAAALASRTFEFDLTAAAAELTVAEAMDALDTLLAAGLVRPARRDGTAGEYRFSHDVLRRSVAARCHADRRRALHRRFVEAIETQRASQLERYSETLARHCAAAAVGPGDPRAVRWAWVAGERAATGGAPHEAVRLHRLALGHVPPDEPCLRAQALTNLGLAQLAAGDSEGEQKLFDGALQALHSGRPEIAAEAAVALADAVHDGSRLRAEAAALVEALLLRPAQQAAYRAGRSGRPAQRESRGALDDLTLGRLLARHRRLGGRVTAGPASSAAVTALSRQLRRLEGPDQLQLRFELAGDLADVADAVGDRRARVIAAHHRAMTAELTGRHAERDQALAVLGAEADESRGGGDPLANALLIDHTVAVAVTEGRFTDAVATARLVGPGMARSGRSIMPLPGGLAARQMHVAGWLRAVAWPADGGFGSGSTLAERTLTALVAGERGRSHLTLRALATGAESMPDGDEWLHAAGLLALCAVEVGDPTTAEAVRSRLSPYAELLCGVGYRSFVAPVSFHLGRLSVVVADWAAAERHLSVALSVLSGRRARPWTALTQLSLARALRGRARPGDHACAQVLEDEARTTLAGLGLRRDLH